MRTIKELALKQCDATWRIALLLLVLEGCAGQSVTGLSGVQLKDPRLADPFDVVDCLLPGQIRQLGARVTYVTDRRPIRTTAEDCAIRGGEYVALDRADYGTALKIWLGPAEGGDPDAQYYTGILYEKGAEGRPNYEKAASWYRQAAERGNSRAAVNLGRLYELGLGVEKSITEARMWFAKASGMTGGGRQNVADGESELPTGRQQAQLDVVQRELGEARSRLTERSSFLEGERRKLGQLKGQVGEGGGEVVAKQARVVKDREREVAELQTKVTALKESAKQQVAAAQHMPAQELGIRAPVIQIVDPALFLTRGIRLEQGRIPIGIQSGRPMRVTGRVISSAGIQSVTANGDPVELDELNTFSIAVPAASGVTRGIPLDIIAVDRQNKQGMIKLLVNTGAMVHGEESMIANPSGFGQYHALVIGNDHYRQWVPLNTAIADATAVAQLLTDKYGFHVKVLKDSTRKEILKTLNDYRKTLSDRDNLLVYYAGHGFLEPLIDRGYWIPVEGDLQDNSEWIEFPAVTDLLELIPARQVLVVADSCFAGKLARSAMARISPDVQGQDRQALLNTVAEKRIRTTLTSGGAQPVLDDGGSGHSIFAEALLGTLSENTAPLETERLFWTVRSRVMQSAERMKFEQIPTYGPIHMAGHEGFGDFVFLPAVRSSGTR